MKLLLDENLSRRVLSRLDDAFDGSTHVTAAGLEQATDRDVWAYARQHDFVVVSKDSDFNDLAFVHGPPPKVVWLRVGNASTDAIAALINTAADTIAHFCADEADAVLTLRAATGRR